MSVANSSIGGLKYEFSYPQTAGLSPAWWTRILFSKTTDTTHAFFMLCPNRGTDQVLLHSYTFCGHNSDMLAPVAHCGKVSD